MKGLSACFFLIIWVRAVIGGHHLTNDEGEVLHAADASKRFLKSKATSKKLTTLKESDVADLGVPSVSANGNLVVEMTSTEELEDKTHKFNNKDHDNLLVEIRELKAENERLKNVKITSVEGSKEYHTLEGEAQELRSRIAEFKIVLKDNLIVDPPPFWKNEPQANEARIRDTGTEGEVLHEAGTSRRKLKEKARSKHTNHETGAADPSASSIPDNGQGTAADAGDIHSNDALRAKTLKVEEYKRLLVKIEELKAENKKLTISKTSVKKSKAYQKLESEFQELRSQEAELKNVLDNSWVISRD